MKRWTPQPGDIVSFKHHGFLINSKKPKLPSIYRVRSDLEWQDVVTTSFTKKQAKPMSKRLATVFRSIIFIP